MELIQHDGRYAVDVGIREKAACEYALGDKPKPRARATDFLKPHLIPDGLTGFFGPFPGDSSRRQPRGDPPWLQDNNFTAHKSKQRRWHTGCLPCTRWCFDHEVRV